MPKSLFFFGCFLVFWLLVKNYKTRFFDDFEMLIFSFFGQKSRVNNLATFLAKILPRKVAKLLTLFFSHFFVKTCFSQKSHYPCRKKKIFWKTKKNKTTKNNKKGGQDIDLRWPSYWPYSIYIYMATYIYIYLSLSVSLFISLYLFLLVGCRQQFLRLNPRVFVTNQSRKHGYWRRAARHASHPLSGFSLLLF